MSPKFGRQMEVINDYIVLRKPAIPKYWDTFSRPHVAIIIDEPRTGNTSRYFISQVGPLEDGRRRLEIVDLDELAKDLSAGTLLEVRYDSAKVNLYSLQNLGGVPCWKWIGKYRGLPCFGYSKSIEWEMPPQRPGPFTASPVTA